MVAAGWHRDDFLCLQIDERSSHEKNCAHNNDDDDERDIIMARFKYLHEGISTYTFISPLYFHVCSKAGRSIIYFNWRRSRQCMHTFYLNIDMRVNVIATQFIRTYYVAINRRPLIGTCWTFEGVLLLDVGRKKKKCFFLCFWGLKNMRSLGHYVKSGKK